MPLEQNYKFELVGFAIVEEILPFSSPDDLTSESSPLNDARRTPLMMPFSYSVIRVIPEATELVSQLYLLLFFIAAYCCSESIILRFEVLPNWIYTSFGT